MKTATTQGRVVGQTPRSNGQWLADTWQSIRHKIGCMLFDLGYRVWLLDYALHRWMKSGRRK